MSPRRRNDYYEDLDEINARARKAIKIYIGKRTWDPEKVERRAPEDYRRASVVPTRCSNPYCREFLPRGSREARRCLACQTPLP